MTRPFTVGVPLKAIAKQLGCSTKTIREWKLKGRKNPYTEERVFPEFTWLPTGEWGMTQEQYDTFLAKLNEKP